MMYNYKIKFTKKPETEKIAYDEICDMIDNYFGAMFNNGQVISGFELYTDSNDVIHLTVVLPREDSLSEKNNNNYVREQLKILQEFFNIEFILEGENLEYCTSCICEKPAWYFLDNEGNVGESPLICGVCQKPVPLYEVPYIFGEKEHFILLDWQRAKNALDKLWIHGLWDKFTYSEKVKHNSKINREGRKICKELEKVLNVPVYYFIYYICQPYDIEHSVVPKGLPREIPKFCPQCGGEWLVDENFYRCQKCRLITDSLQWKKERNLL